MSFEKSIFEKEGLKIDKDRVLTYSQLSCPLDCKYCFVDDLNFNQKKNVSYLSEKQFGLIEKLPEDIKIIMLGCDTEFFQSRENSLEILEKLSELNKDISVITKLALSESFLKKLGKINEKLNKNGKFLALSVSLTCLESAKKWEPGAPDPEQRIETLKKAYGAGLETMVAIRPLLPSVSHSEIEKIVLLTKDYCYGYYSGPLYIKNLKLLKEEKMEGLEIDEIQPHWMPEGHVFYKVEKEGQMDLLKKLVEQNGKPFFEGAAEGIKYLRNKK